MASVYAMHECDWSVYGISVCDGVDVGKEMQFRHKGAEVNSKETMSCLTLGNPWHADGARCAVVVTMLTCRGCVRSP